MDYYGVASGEILVMIDLDSLHVELAFHKTRYGEACVRAVRECIINRHEKIDELRSDHAREFIGVVMTHLKDKAQYQHTTMEGYNPTGNATIERF